MEEKVKKSKQALCYLEYPPFIEIYNITYLRMSCHEATML